VEPTRSAKTIVAIFRSPAKLVIVLKITGMRGCAAGEAEAQPVLWRSVGR